MKFATLMLKKTITRVAELMMERADKDYIEPQDVSYKSDEGENYFSVIGSQGSKLHKSINKKLPEDTVTLDKKAKIRVEVDQGLGLTSGGKKEAMTVIMNHLVQLYQLGFLGPSALALAIKRELETYGYGSTEEFMEEVENGVTQGQMSNTQMMQMQMAVVKALKDAQVAGPDADKRLVDSTKLGVLQTLKDAGLIKQTEAEGKPGDAMAQLVNLYKVAPPDIRRQVEQLIGLQPSQDEPVSLDQAKTAKELHTVIKDKKDMQDTAPETQGEQ